MFALIPLLPLFASLALVLGGARWREHGHRVGIPAIGLSFALSVWACVEVIQHGPISISLYRLFQSGSLIIDLGMYIDQLTVLLLLLVTGVSGVVHVYSSNYMIGDPRYNRFFAVIALFTFSMLMLVSSTNLLMLFICWEIMGMCSYLLISHWSERPSACRAATKAFLVNAVADVGLGFGIILTFFTFGTLDIQHIVSQTQSMQEQTINVLEWAGLDLHVYSLTIIPICILIGAMGKSAQMPFHVWLPFAMEAPTPVSALIHAATMVNAGPFLLIRLSPLIVLSPFAMTIIAVVGAVTALFAAIVSLTQSDIKKVLAYSTMSHIGFMIMTCGIGAFVAATFHLLAHGCLKAFLFLSTGNTLRTASSHHSHVDTQHGTPSQAPTSLYAGAFILACLPPFIIFSGPYESVWIAQNFVSAKIGFWIIGLTTVFFTAMYLFQGIISIFQHAPVKPDPTNPLSKAAQPQIFSPAHLLGICIGGGFMAMVLLAAWTWFAQFLTPAFSVTTPRAMEAFEETSPGFGPWIILPLFAAIGGWAYALSRYRRSSHPSAKQSKFMQTLYVTFLNKGYFDELYELYIVQPTLRFANWLWRIVDVRGIDAAIHMIATSSLLFARWLWRVIDVQGIDRAVIGIGQHSIGLSRWLWRVVDVRWLDHNMSEMGKRADAAGELLQEVESRTIQHQLLVMVFWLVLATGILYLLI
ncbi:MAG: NADH-quinone oxidoreductase subunit L [Nitrospirales bacterium]|nr:MAG: NADH-quinone oxidoreductase subunit L [Nitrospirales bacterium]